MPTTFFRRFLRFAAICGDGIMFWLTIMVMSVLAIITMSMYNNIQETATVIERQVTEIPLIVQEELERTRLLYRNQSEMNRDLLVRQHMESREEVKRQLEDIKTRYAAKRSENAKVVAKEQSNRQDRSFFSRLKKILLF